MVTKINFETAALILSDVPEDRVFFTKDGSKFFNLSDLMVGLKKMSKETFEYHVNSEKNDFSTWIYDVLGDSNLADNLRKCKEQKDFVKKIKTRITYLKKNKNGGV